MITINKQLAVSEDIAWGFGTIAQIRDIQGVGTSVDYNQICADVIPAKLDVGTESLIQTALDEKETKFGAIAKYALLDGDETNKFKVADPLADNEAANKLYVDTEIIKLSTSGSNNYVLRPEVLTKDNVDIYVPTLSYHPATKLFVEQTVVNIGAGDMAKGVYDHSGTVGIVDNSEALGGIEAAKISSYRGVAVDANSLEDHGYWDGNGIINSPDAGSMILHNLKGYSVNAIIQKAYSLDTGKMYSRQRDASSSWTQWAHDIISSDIADNLTTNNPDMVLSAAQGKILGDALSSSSSVPIGTVVMFGGIIGDLSSSWHICDGNAGTPNLIDKFVMGTNMQGSIGLEGGTEEATMPSHTHTANHDHYASSVSDGDHYHGASHNHSAYANTAGNHRHNLKTKTTSVAGNNIKTSTLLAGGSWEVGVIDSSGEHSHDITVNTKTFNTSSSGVHTHAITVDTKIFNTGSAIGSGDNRPPYYVLAYIMKIS